MVGCAPAADESGAGAFAIAPVSTHGATQAVQCEKAAPSRDDKLGASGGETPCAGTSSVSESAAAAVAAQDPLPGAALQQSQPQLPPVQAARPAASVLSEGTLPTAPLFSMPGS